MHTARGEMSLVAGRQASERLKLFKGEPAVSVEPYRGHASFLSELVAFGKLIIKKFITI